MTDDQKLGGCLGCRDDFYNDKNPIGVKRCWKLARAEVVVRFRLNWWTQPRSKNDFQRVVTLDCHYATGRYVNYPAIPRHLL